jgi:glycosyltransferase involved in cell wall biosynthesis
MTDLMDSPAPAGADAAPALESRPGPADHPVFLYFGNNWFAENRTSSHQIARELAKRHKVYYFECPGLRAPGGSRRDLKKVFAKLWSFFRGPRAVEGGITVRTLLQLPLHRFAVVRWLNRAILRATVRGMMWREGVRRPVTWFHIPHLPQLVGRLSERLAVYCCIDDYSALPGVNAEAVRAMDDETTCRADVVLLASDTLLDGKRALNPNTHVSPHGVDVEHFARALDESRPGPADIAHLRRPIVGFFGLIEKWIDLELVDFLAARRPEWEFLLIGRVAVPADDVPHRPNIHFVGARPYETLPDYGSRFDAAIIPYRLTRQVLHANPIKLREYLAMGKPVVSVSTPQIDKYADVVEIARDREEFLARLDRVLERPPSRADAARRVARVAAESWPARVRNVLQVLDLAPADRVSG